MKNTLALVLMVFGIVGCTSFAPSTKVIEVSHNMEVTSRDTSKNETHIWQTRVVKNYDDLTVGTDSDRAEAMSIETGEKFHIGNYPLGFFAVNKHKLESTLIRNCEKLFKSKCVTTRTNIGRAGGGAEDPFFAIVVRPETDTVYYTNLEDYNQKELERKHYAEVKAKLDKEAEIKAEREMEERKLAVIHALKERCISYGFSGSNNIAACVQREAQHDYEIEQKEYELQLTKQQLLTQKNQQQVVPEMPWYLLALEALAKGIEKGYEQQALINAMDSRYERKDIWRYCRPNC